MEPGGNKGKIISPQISNMPNIRDIKNGRRARKNVSA